MVFIKNIVSLYKKHDPETDRSAEHDDYGIFPWVIFYRDSKGKLGFVRAEKTYKDSKKWLRYYKIVFSDFNSLATSYPSSQYRNEYRKTLLEFVRQFGDRI